MAILNQTLRSIELPPEQTAHTGGKGIAERADLTGTDPDLSQTRWGIDWRPNNAPEFTWYSDDPETITTGESKFLMCSGHCFSQPVTRWMRLYVYHQALFGARRVKVGVYNRDASRPIRVSAAILRPTKPLTVGNWRLMSNLAALSTDQADDSYDDVESAPFGPHVSVGGWTIIEDFAATSNHMLHRIYELSVAPATPTDGAEYFVAAFTTDGDNIELEHNSAGEAYIVRVAEAS